MATFVILTPGFPASEEDTSCLPPVQQFILSLKKLYPGISFTVISFQYPFENKEYWWNGIRIIALGGKNKSKFRRLITWIKAYVKLRRLNRENKVSGLLSLWLTECALVGQVFAKRHKTKHYIWLHGQDAKKSNKYIRRVRPNASQLIAISEFTKNEFFKNHAILPETVATNGITETIFPVLNSHKRTIDILGVGALISLKNYKLFLQIISEIKKKSPEIKVVIVGEGPQERDLKMLSKKLGLESSVEFTGAKKHSAVLDLMNNSRIFLHTSDYEGNSTVVIEALYSGCKVIARQNLGVNNVNNLIIASEKAEIVAAVTSQLSETTPSERVLFNTMDRTAQTIMDLFLE